MGTTKSKTNPSAFLIPIIPLARSTVLLPGATLRVPTVNRPDLVALLAHLYSRSPNSEAPLTIGCVPLNSPYLSRDGKRLIDDGVQAKEEAYETDPAKATREDLFGYGCIGRVSGAQGRRQGELSLVIEGVSRIRVEEVVKEVPYFEGKVVVCEDAGMSVKKRVRGCNMLTVCCSRGSIG